MLASIQKLEEGFLAIFERHLPHSVEDVWAMLTDNDKIPLWFPELRVQDLREGGIIQFSMPDGSAIDMIIIDYKTLSVLEYTWGEDLVRFELSPQAEGTYLVLKETIHKITDHTPKDLAGWHVCLNVIEVLLNGKSIDNLKEEWEKWYEQYVVAVQNL